LTKNVYTLRPVSPLSRGGVTNGTDSFALVSLFDWTKPPGVSFTYSDVIALNELVPFRA